MATFGRDVSFDYWNDEEIEAEKTIFAKYFSDPCVDSLKPSHREAYEDCIAFVKPAIWIRKSIINWVRLLLA